MYKDLPRFLRGTLTLVVLVFVGAGVGVLIGLCIDNGSKAGTPVLEAIHHVNKQLFVEHYLVVDVYLSDAPENWFAWLGKLGIRQDFVVLVRGRVPAGFDLTKVGERHIWTSADGKRVQLTLPADHPVR